MPPRSLFAMAVSTTLLGTPAALAQPGRYSVRSAFTLSVGPDRMRGRLELLEDARIRPSMRTAIADAYGMNPCTLPRVTPVLRPLCETAATVPLRPALLRLLDDSGRVVAEREAERPLATLTSVRLLDSVRRTFLFTVDLSAGIGSYSGPLTRLAEPVGNSFGWVMVGGGSAADDTLTLVSTLKSGWRRVPRADGRGKDLLQVLCRPDLTPADSAARSTRFLLTLERYTFDGRQWERRRRWEPGCWEADDSASFPARKRFP